MPFSILVACTMNGGIGQNGKIPWYNSEDLKYFQEITTHTMDASKTNAVIMGRKTWESLPKRPLRGRRNVVITKSTDASTYAHAGAIIAASLDDALRTLQDDPTIESIHVIGGGEIYQEAIVHPECTRVHLTRMHRMMECDTFFPLNKMQANFELVIESLPKWSKDMSYTYVFEEYARVHQTTSTNVSS